MQVLLEGAPGQVDGVVAGGRVGQLGADAPGRPFEAAGRPAPEHGRDQAPDRQGQQPGTGDHDATVSDTPGSRSPFSRPAGGPAA